MAIIDLSGYSLDKLLALRSDLDKAIEAKKADNRKVVTAKIKKLLADNGMKLEDLTGGSGKRGRPLGRKSGSRGKVPPKYRNPNKAAETWTGRGRKPRWVDAYLKAGGKIQDLEI